MTRDSLQCDFCDSKFFCFQFETSQPCLSSCGFDHRDHQYIQTRVDVHCFLAVGCPTHHNWTLTDSWTSFKRLNRKTWSPSSQGLESNPSKDWHSNWVAWDWSVPTIYELLQGMLCNVPTSFRAWTLHPSCSRSPWSSHYLWRTGRYINPSNSRRRLYGKDLWRSLALICTRPG